MLKAAMQTQGGGPHPNSCPDSAGMALWAGRHAASHLQDVLFLELCYVLPLELLLLHTCRLQLLFIEGDQLVKLAGDRRLLQPPSPEWKENLCSCSRGRLGNSLKTCTQNSAEERQVAPLTIPSGPMRSSSSEASI